MDLYISTKLHQNIAKQGVSKLLSGHDFQIEIFQGAQFSKNIGGVMVLVLCTPSDSVYICTYFCENISKGWELLCRHYFHCEICKGA